MNKEYDHFFGLMTHMGRVVRFREWERMLDMGYKELEEMKQKPIPLKSKCLHCDKPTE
jgi:hypothetical protein